MNKLTIHLAANNQQLTSADCPKQVASNTVSYIEAVFDLGDNWTGYDSVRAVWATYNNQISTVLDSQGTCIVPHEVLTETQTVYVNLVGSNVEGDELVDRLTTYPLPAIIVNADALVEGTETAEVTPSQFEQFIADVAEEVSRIKDIVSTTLNDDYTLTFVFSDGTETTVGPIRGEQGPQGETGPQGPEGPPGEVTLATLESLMPTDTANGSIASFPDGQSVFPLKSLVAEINPIQDLHGYDSPWVGGGGKNKLCTRGTTTTINDVTFTVNADGSIKVKGTASANARFNISHQVDTLVAGTYTLSGGYSNNVYITLLDKDGAFPISGGVIDYGSGKTFTLPSDLTQYSCRLMVLSGTAVDATIYPMIESGSPATTWTPYENICPISGWSGVDVARCGINVWDEVAEVGGLNVNTGATTVANRTRSKNYIPCVPNTSYYWKLPSSSGLAVCYYDASKTFVSGAWVFENQAHTTPANAYFMKFSTGDAYGTTYNNDISVNYPSTDHDYHAYNGTIYTVSWSGDAGTVYGGTLDVVSGVLTVDSIKVTFDGTEDGWQWYQNFNQAYIALATPAYYDASLATYKCNMLQPCANSDRGDNIGNYASLISSGASAAFSTPAQSLADFKTLISGQNLDFCYKLATPTTIQLTPTQVQTLLGQNNIFADSGDVSVEYVADIQGYVDKQIQ